MIFDSTTIQSIGIARINRILGELEVIPVSGVDYKNISDSILSHVTSDFLRDRVPYSFNASEKSNAIKDTIHDFFNHNGALSSLMTSLSNRLTRCSSHHLIKKGELMGVHLKDILIDDELVDGLVIAKMDVNAEVIQIEHEPEASIMNLIKGALLGKLDKACLILDMDEDEGYSIYLSSAAGKTEAKYWKDEFLCISPKEMGFAPTEQYLDLAQSFIKEQIYQEPSTNHVEKHGVLFDAGEFFKKNQQYNDHDWKKEVLGEKPERVEAWEQHKADYSRNTGNPLPDSFGISNLAVKQHSKYFKSVLKLDKNFHVYVHGDRSKIVHGVDDDGRKFYKLYYEEEQ